MADFEDLEKLAVSSKRKPCALRRARKNLANEMPCSGYTNGIEKPSSIMEDSVHSERRRRLSRKGRRMFLDNVQGTHRKKARPDAVKGLPLPVIG